MLILFTPMIPTGMDDPQIYVPIHRRNTCLAGRESKSDFGISVCLSETRFALLTCHPQGEQQAGEQRRKRCFETKLRMIGYPSKQNQTWTSHYSK